MIQAIIWEGQLQGRFEDPQAAKAIFRQHVNDVKATVPPGRLLVFHVREGWGPLCEFLGVPVPDDKLFPHLNERAAMKRIILIVRLVGKLPYILAAIGLAWLGASILF